MRRSLLLFLAVVLCGAAIVSLSSLVARWVCAQHLTRPDDDLAWLRQEFHLSNADMQRIRQLHEGYLPKCREMCDHIAAKKAELQTALTKNQGATLETEQILAEVAALRAQCQAQMLRHFTEVSQAMPPEQGQRYLAEMKRLTLGFHEQTEQSMPNSTGGAHGHD